MSKMIEFSDSDYAEIHEAASAAGMTPDEWIVTNLRLTRESREPVVRLGPDGQPAKTMYDLFAGRIGRFDSSGDGRLSEDHSELFGEYLEEKRRRGNL